MTSDAYIGSRALVPADAAVHALPNIPYGQVLIPSQPPLCGTGKTRKRLS